MHREVSDITQSRPVSINLTPAEFHNELMTATEPGKFILDFVSGGRVIGYGGPVSFFDTIAYIYGDQCLRNYRPILTGQWLNDPVFRDEVPESIDALGYAIWQAYTEVLGDKKAYPYWGRREYFAFMILESTVCRIRLTAFDRQRERNHALWQALKSEIDEFMIIGANQRKSLEGLRRNFRYDRS